jgi:hypothetical protein
MNGVEVEARDDIIMLKGYLEVGQSQQHTPLILNVPFLALSIFALFLFAC